MQKRQKWRDEIVLRKHLAIFEQDGHKDEYKGLTDREQWNAAS